MGDVWLADDVLLGRKVALKFVGERQLRETPGAAEILRDEARTGGRLLGHPQVVAVLDLLDVDATLHKGPAVVMEFVDGCNVAEWIADIRLKTNEATRLKIGLYIALEATEAVSEAHKLGILHRDIKPQNILCSTAGRIKVADFGLARVVEAITRTHTVWGHHTPLYSAPEQWNEQKPDKATDVYQLCSTIYHLLAGQPANEGRSLIGLVRWHESSRPRPLQDLVPDIDRQVADVVMAGLSKDPEGRPPSWQIFDALAGALMKQLQLVVSVSGSDDALVEAVASLTDFDKKEIVQPEGQKVRFPNPLEALREALGTLLLGGTAVINELPDAKEAPKAP